MSHSIYAAIICTLFVFMLVPDMSDAGDENAPDVNNMLIQYFINYDFPGFYLTSAPIITANWEASEGQQWIVPLGICRFR